MPAAPASAAFQQRLPPAVRPAYKKPVVLVDDEKSYTDLMTGILAEHLDCGVHAFAHPLEALPRLGNLDPAVVVTDYFMPQMNGIEFIRRAAPLVPGAVFILISGQDLSAVQDDIDRLPRLAAFLAKPFGWRRLGEEIRRVWPPETAAPSNAADATSV